MYGLRPSTSGVYMNSPKPWTIKDLQSRITLPRHFAVNGYQTFTTGKIYHGSGLPPNDFDVVGPRPGQRQRIDRRLIPPTQDGAKGLWDFGPQSYQEELFQDYVDASWAIEILGRRSEQPFFLAVGFYRPHVPLYSPTRVFNEISAEAVQLPQVKIGDRDDLPSITKTLTIAPAAPDHAWFVENGRWKEAVQSYLACVRWTDEQVGRLMDALSTSSHAANTIVVLYSDHGFFLGEKERWAKQSLWEQATRVPLIIKVPGMKQGQRCYRPVELLSIYPTLIDSCGLTIRKDLEGISLKPLLQNPNDQWPHMAITTFGKDNHSVRSESHRYIRYSDGSEEVYDLRNDPNEWHNLAGDESMSSLKSDMAKFFPEVNAEPAETR